jgi:hypothetical protein
VNPWIIVALVFLLLLHAVELGVIGFMVRRTSLQEGELRALREVLGMPRDPR